MLVLHAQRTPLSSRKRRARTQSDGEVVDASTPARVRCSCPPGAFKQHQLCATCLSWEEDGKALLVDGSTRLKMVWLIYWRAVAGLTKGTT